MSNTSNSYIFMCFRAACSTQRLHNSCALELLAQQKYQILMRSRASCSTQKSNTHVPQSSCSTQYIINYVIHGPRPTHEIIYIKHMHLAYAQYIKQIIILMCSGVSYPIYKIKHQRNITCNWTYAHKCEVKNSGYYRSNSGFKFGKQFCKQSLLNIGSC